MRPKTPEQVRDLLIRELWNPSVVFYEGAKDCRNLHAALIRSSLPLLRNHPSAGKDLWTLVESARPEEPDEAIETSWRFAIDALRALYRTSPIGTERERETLLSIARNQRLVKAMTAAASSEPRIDPSWLAVLNAEGSPESLALVRRQMAEQISRPDLLAGIASFEGALLSTPSTPSVAGTAGTNPLPVQGIGETFTRAHFWKLIDSASKDIDPVGTLGQGLRQMKPRHVAAFDRHFNAVMNRAYRLDLWGAAALLLEGCSEDSFSDFRAELILQGKAVFDLVLKNPDALADHTNIQGDESVAALAAEIYEEQTGRALPSKRGLLISEPPAGPPFEFANEDEMRKRYPRLFALRMPAPKSLKAQ